MRKSSLLAGLLFFLLNSKAQKVDSLLTIIESSNPIEKIFIHYDKENYIAGETIWFKAYLLNAALPSGLSTNFYIRMISESGEVIVDQKYPVFGATAKGNIDIPDSLVQGNYLIEATTAANSIYGEDFIYQRTFFIYNPSHLKTAEERKRKIDVQFFPESGLLVDGISTVLAFKAIDENGMPVNIAGIIKTDEGTTITSFKSYHDGMGRIQFKPKSGKKYIAEVELNGGTQSFDIPSVQKSGINLSIQDEKGGKMFLLSRGAAEKVLYDKVTLIATIQNKVVYNTEIDFEDYPSVKGHLITDSLPSGILQFTVFNASGIPIAERCTFVNNREYISATQLESEKKDFGKKAANTLLILFPEAIQRSLSVSITDASLAGDHVKESIWSSFLLTEDIKGYVHNPGWYFDHTGDSVATALDNLLLTQGWTRLDWDKIVRGNDIIKTFQQDDYFLKVTGTINDANTRQPVAGGYLNLFIESEDSSTFNYEVPVSDKGIFVLDSISYSGSSKFYYGYTTAQGKLRSVQISAQSDTSGIFFKTAKPLMPKLAMVKSASVISKQFEWMEDNKQNVKVLERVTVGATPNKQPLDIVNEKYTTGVFRTLGKVNLDNVTNPSKDRAQNVMDFIKNRIQQVELQGNGFVSRKNFSLINGQKWAVGVFIDEIPADASLLRTMRVDELALVKYFEAGFVGAGSGTPGGALAIYTKRNDKKQEFDKVEYFTSKGYTISRKFYSPLYDVKSQLAEKVDRRPTLYWNPDLYADSEDKIIKINFFNNDIANEFRVVIEGFDVNGKLIHVIKTISR